MLSSIGVLPLVPPCTFPTSPASLRPPQTRRRPRCRPCFSPRHAAVPSANTCLKAPMTVMRGVLRVKGRTIGPKYLCFWGFLNKLNNTRNIIASQKWMSLWITLVERMFWRFCWTRPKSLDFRCRWVLRTRGPSQPSFPTIREPAQFPRNPLSNS